MAMPHQEYFNPEFDDLVEALDSPYKANQARKVRIGNLTKAFGWHDARSYVSINEAVSSIGSTQTILVVSNAQTLSANLTIPSTLTLKIIPGGSISGTSTYTLAINGFFDAGPYEVFPESASGNVTFRWGAVKEIYVEWWGGAADSTFNVAGSGTDSTTAFNCAVNSGTSLTATGGNKIYSQTVIRLLAGTYRITAPIIMAPSVRIVGAGRLSTYIYANDAEIDHFQLVDAPQNEYSDFTFYNGIAAATNSAGSALKLTAASDLKINRVGFERLYNAITVVGTTIAVTIQNSYFATCTDYVIRLATGAVITTWNIYDNRFEQTFSGFWINALSSVGTFSVTFEKNSFESCYAAKALDFGTDVQNYRFIGNHVEANGIDQTTAYDLYFGTSCKGVVVKGNLFAAMNATVTTGVGIRVGAENDISIIDNVFKDTTTGYKAVHMSNRLARVHLYGNQYGDTLQSYISEEPEGGMTLRYMDDTSMSGTTYGESPDGASNAFGSRKNIATTDATATLIWSVGYLPINCLVHATADVVGVSSDNAVRATYHIKYLGSKGANAATFADYNQTYLVAYETDAGLLAAFAMNGNDDGRLQLVVTGLAATNMKWIAHVTYTIKQW